MGARSAANARTWKAGAAPRLARAPLASRGALASHGASSQPPLAKSRAARPMMASAAIRIPERVSAQLALAFPCSSPQLFIHEGARQSLERRLAAAHPGPVAISITDNRHRIISHSERDGVLRARIHHMFLGAPLRVQDALIRYVTAGDRTASAFIGSFIEANGGKLARRSRGLPLHTRGKHHDLLSILSDLNARYFDHGVNAVITWGPRRGKPSEGSKTRARPARSTIKLGSYSALDRLIRIHPALDRAWVPRYFVAFVVYHEMLHHAIPARRVTYACEAGSERRALHPPEFREREREFRFYDRATAWERRSISRLLRA